MYTFKYQEKLFLSDQSLNRNTKSFTLNEWEQEYEH